MPTNNQHIYTISGENGAKMLKKLIFAIKLCFYNGFFSGNFRVGTAIGKSIAATAITISAKLIAATAIAIFLKIDSRYRFYVVIFREN